MANAEWTGSGMSVKQDLSWDPNPAGKEKLKRPSGKPWITGKNGNVHIERMIVANFGMHIRAESDTARNVESHGDISCFSYDTSATTVTVMVATSLISAEQATINLNREIRLMTRQGDGASEASTGDAAKTEDARQFDVVAWEARRTWNELLRRVDVVDPGILSGWAVRNLEIFYSGLARALSFPRRLDEVDADGMMVHYSPYSPRGDVRPGPVCTDNGFWDTFRTVYPLLSLLYPDHLSQIVQGWLNAFKEGGWLPTWASPGYRNCMVGTFADVVVADAIVKGVKGFEINTAIDALMKDSFTDPPSHAGNAVGKGGLNQYSRLGYIPAEDRNKGTEVVSRSLDFGFADFAVANAFQVLAKKDSSRAHELVPKAAELSKRSKMAVNGLFSRDFGLMAPMDMNRQPKNWFRPTEWGNGFTEGNSWHHSFPPYAVNAEDGGDLSRLHGGKDALARKIVEMITMPSVFQPGSYGQEIHEMVEARALAMGQYGHNNQPVHHILWLLMLLGQGPRKIGEESIRRVMHKAYGTDFFAGDEDNGEQGAWFALAALGLFSTTPGTLDYVLGTPVFRHVRVQRTPKPPVSMGITGNSAVGEPQKSSSGAPEYLDIVALGTSESNLHVSKVTFNDQDIVNLATIPDAKLQSDGVLRFYFDGEDHSSAFDRNAATANAASYAPPVVAQHGDGPALEALKQKLEDKENEMHHQKEQEDGLVHVLQTEITTLKKRETEQNEILVELEQRLEQAGVSMNETSALIHAIHLSETNGANRGLIFSLFNYLSPVSMVALAIIVALLVLGIRNRRTGIRPISSIGRIKGDKENV
jgi:predicted alpha-1,2-mannosidase